MAKFKQVQPVQKVSKEEELISYFLINASGGMLSLDTGLKVNVTERHKRAVVLTLPKDNKPYAIKAMDGFSAKQLYEAPGVVRHEEKSLVRRLVKKQKVLVTK